MTVRDFEELFRLTKLVQYIRAGILRVRSFALHSSPAHWRHRQGTMTFVELLWGVL